MPVVLGSHQTFSFGRHDRDMIGERIPADEDTTGMYSGLTDRTFEGLGKLYCFGNQWIKRLLLFLEIRVFLISFFQSHFRSFRNHFGQPVGF